MQLNAVPPVWGNLERFTHPVFVGVSERASVYVSSNAASTADIWYVANGVDEATLNDPEALKSIVRLWAAKHGVEITFADEKGDGA